MKRSRNFFFYFSITLSIIFLGCKSHQKKENISLSQANQKVTQTNDSIFQSSTIDSIFLQLERNYILPVTLSGKFNCTYEAEKDNYNFRGIIRLKTNKLIWISINSLLNIEVARFLITPDSIYFVNRLNKTYFKGNFQDAVQLFNISIDFDMIQSFILNKDFAYYEKNIFKVNYEKDNILLSTPNRVKLKKYVKNKEELNKVYIQDIWIDPAIWKIKKQKIKEITNPNLLFIFEYNNFKEISPGKLFPYDYLIEINANKKTKLSVSFSKLTLNDSIYTNFKIPSDYSNMIEKK
jgi:hypothetical protein